jgi:hypothetical protein
MNRVWAGMIINDNSRLPNPSSPSTGRVICRGRCGAKWQARGPAMRWLASRRGIRGSDGWY